MGDRAHVYIHRGKAPGVYLYTHHGGTELPADVQDALAEAQSRWGDTSYLTRIFISVLDPSGVSAHPDDPGDGGRVVCVDDLAQTITLKGHGQTNPPVPYAAYLDMPSPHWPGR